MIKPKQIVWYAGAPIRIAGIAATGSSTVITTPLTTALATAGRGGVSVPVQASAAEGLGVIATAPTNLCQVQLSASGDKQKDASGNEVYARLTESSGAYTLSYYTLVSGVETAYSFSSSTNIDVDFSYRFDFGRLPTDFAIALGVRTIANDPRSASAGASLFTEFLTVTATNTVGNLTKTPNTTANVMLIVNNAIYTTLGGGSAEFTVSGKTITWSTANSGFSLETTDRVVAWYTTTE